jgi:hypothetical protein
MKWSLVSIFLSPIRFRGLVSLYVSRTCGFESSEYEMTDEVVIFIHELACI